MIDPSKTPPPPLNVQEKLIVWTSAIVFFGGIGLLSYLTAMR